MSQPKQEIRIAVVMYGGVSLCIYIHGVAQELLRLVRATSGANISDDKVTEIYSKLAQEVRSLDPKHQDERVPTRFVIDLLSGTSAGGINAVFLAKAIAIRAKNLDQLRNTWLDKADMDKLLDAHSGPFTSKRSLLKGQWMYEELLSAFRDMNTAPQDPEAGYRQVEQIDLFVTTTDLNGVPIPIRLSDQDVNERVHKGSFHFQFDATPVPAITGTPGCTTDAPALSGKNHFEKDYDPMLAFAARCTSSFPVAFPPMKLSNIAAAVGTAEYARLAKKYREFFRWIPPQPLVPAKALQLDFDERELADGGYLDNKPFGYIVDALTYRATPVLHARKLIYIDPFPESTQNDSDSPHFDFVRNAKSAAMELPRYETIREDIARIKLSNRTQDRLKILKSEVIGRWTTTRPEDLHDFDEKFKDSGLKERVKVYGPGYETYHFTRVADVTDDLARNIARIRGAMEDEDLFLAIRYLARHWRSVKYAPDGGNGKETENVFLSKFDFSFRMRRLIDLMEWNHKNGNDEISQNLIQQLARLRRTREQLCSCSDQNPLYSIIEKIGSNLSWDTICEIVRVPEDEDRIKIAAAIYNRPGLAADFQALVDKIASIWDVVFCHNRSQLKALRAKYPEFEKYYQSFDFREMLSLTFLEGSDVSEHTVTEIYRVSPADGIQRSPDKKKLAGTALMDFGAFLNRDWRLNDMLWGRLDASERIVSAVLPHQDDAEKRKCYVDQLRTAILQQEMDLRTVSDPVTAAAKAAIDKNQVPQFLTDRYEVPLPPPPKQSVKWLAQASTILGGMFEDDLGHKDRFTKMLKTAGSVVTSLVGFLVPHSVANILFRYWLSIVFFFCLFLSGVGWLFNRSEMLKVGLISAVVVVLVWLAATWIGAYFDRRWLRFLGWLVVVPLAIVLWLGVRDAVQLVMR